MTSKYDVNGGEVLPQPPYSAIITLPLMRQDIIHGVWVPKSSFSYDDMATFHRIHFFYKHDICKAFLVKGF